MNMVSEIAFYRRGAGRPENNLGALVWQLVRACLLVYDMSLNTVARTTSGKAHHGLPSNIRGVGKC